MLAFSSVKSGLLVHVVTLLDPLEANSEALQIRFS